MSESLSTTGVTNSRFVALVRSFFSTLLTILVTFVGLLFVTFCIGRLLPIDPVLAVVGDHAPQAVYDRVFLEMGLDKPVLVQFFDYVLKVFQGDLGQSVLTARPVWEDIKQVFPATLELASIATIIGVSLGIPCGVYAAVYQGKWQDYLIRFFGLVGYSAPVFWLGLLGLLFFYAKLDWVAGPGRIDFFFEDTVPVVTGMLTIDSLLDGNIEVFKNAVSHIILPTLLLAYYSLAYISRMTRSFMLEQLQQEYITTARVKGVPEWKVIWYHALGNIRVPLLTVIVLSYAGLLEGSVLTETVFSWPGLGKYITNSLLNADMNAVLGGTIVVGFVFICMNLISDILYRLLDPRAKS